MEKFTDMTRAQKRVAIAKDTLKHIEAGYLQVQSGTYFKLLVNDYNPKKSLRSILKTNNPCEVCVRGGLFYSYVRKVNEFACPISQLAGTATNTGMGVDDRSNRRARRKLEEVFTRRQLALIEHAFEGQFNEGFLSNEEAVLAKRFFVEHYGNLYRMVAILNNIIDNKGTFKP